MISEKIIGLITELYGVERAPGVVGAISSLLERYGDLTRSERSEWLTEGDVMLITYADTLWQDGGRPLQSLGRFCRGRLKELVSIVHVLPFFPYSSDDGFSVIDYRQVKADHGDWADLAVLNEDFDLCFDLVVNHVSKSSRYFQGFLAGQPAYRDFFIVMDPEADTSSVLRPRALPLLHRYETAEGPRWCWTTFSEDQIDWNFRNPAVLLEMLDILLFYAARGARVIRLDAIGYLWKQLGTSCAHLPQTHKVVQLMREILQLTARQVLLLTETNVPQAENLSYFGDGYNEAQIVYNFPLPPLVLHTLTAGNARYLSEWARTLEPVSEQTTFLNFTASHDGIGVRPAADILSAAEFDRLVALARRHGGDVSYKYDSKGNAIAYELNVSYYDAINDPDAVEVEEEEQIARFLLSQSIALVLRGTPAIYLHSLLGSRNWAEGVAQTGRARSINRQKLSLEEVEAQLDDPHHRRAKVFRRYGDMLAIRRRQKAFAPRAEQRIIDAGDSFFVLLRTSEDGLQRVIAVHNVTGQSRQVILPSGQTHLPGRAILSDVLSAEQYGADRSGDMTLRLKPYQVVWLQFESND